LVELHLGPVLLLQPPLLVRELSLVGGDLVLLGGVVGDGDL
jgi:hypothetical protein